LYVRACACACVCEQKSHDVIKQSLARAKTRSTWHACIFFKKCRYTFLQKAREEMAAKTAIDITMYQPL